MGVIMGSRPNQYFGIVPDKDVGLSLTCWHNLKIIGGNFIENNSRITGHNTGKILELYYIIQG